MKNIDKNKTVCKRCGKWELAKQGYGRSYGYE